jgi:hypothetical protein
VKAYFIRDVNRSGFNADISESVAKHDATTRAIAYVLKLQESGEPYALSLMDRLYYNNPYR